MTTNNKKVTIETTINAPVGKVWEYWTKPEHIVKWNNASDDWHTTKSENDLRAGGSFSSRMEAKDGSFGFDFGGIYDEVRDNEYIAYTMADGRTVQVTLTPNGDSTHVKEVFDPENANPVEFQQQGWQAILDNFKKYAETN